MRPNPQPLEFTGERTTRVDSAARDGLLTADDVAGLLGVPKSWVYEQSRRGLIPTVTLGRYRRYRRTAIDAWVAQLEAPARGRARIGAAR